MPESPTVNEPSGSPGTNPADSAFRFPVGFDPLRWVYAIVVRCYWPILFALGLAATAFFFGSKLSSTRYSVSLQLIKKPVPSVIKTGELGDSFRPRQLNDRSLSSTLLANEAIFKTANALRIDPEDLRRSVEISQLEGTDFFYITVHSNESPERAIETVNLWADEIIHYTIGLQRREALAMQELLQEESSDLARERDRINQLLLSFSTDHDFLDGDKQLEASLRSIAALELQLEDARIQRSAKGKQIATLEEELKAQSPVAGQLKTAREELAQLRGRYTDENPLVKEKLYEIDYLQSKLAEESEGESDLRQFTGTPLGNQLYLEIVQARNELLQLEQTVSEYARLLEKQRTDIQVLPRQILRYGDLLQQREQVRKAYQLLNSRLQEARIFAENAPGYWEVFQAPSLTEVSTETNNKKAVLFALAAFIGGASLGIFLSLVLEFFRPLATTALEYSIAAKALPKLELTADDPESWNESLNAFWITDLIRLQREGYLVVITVQGSANHEKLFWQALNKLSERDETPLALIDLSADSGSPVIPFTHWRQVGDWKGWAKERIKSGPVIARLSGDPYPAVIPVLEQAGHWLCLIDNSSRLRDIRRRIRLFEPALGSPDGTILIRPKPANPVARLFDQLGLVLGSVLGKTKQPTAPNL